MNGFYEVNMRNKLLSMLILAAVLTLAGTTAPAQAVIIGSPEAAPKISMPSGNIKVGPLVTALEIKGNKTIPESEIMDAVFSKIGDILIEEKVQSDLKAIYAMGYFDDVTASFESYEKGTRIIFNVVENPKLTNISFEGNTIYSAVELKAMMKSKVGVILNYKVLQDDIQAIND